MRLAVSQETVPLAERILSGYFKETERGTAKVKYGGVKITKESDLAFVGVVGNGMWNKPDVTGIASSALGSHGINIRYNMDPGPVSLGYIVGRNAKTTAIETLHKQSFS